MSEQNLTPDIDDTEGHAKKDDDILGTDDTEGHAKKDDDTLDTDDTDDTEGHKRV